MRRKKNKIQHAYKNKIIFYNKYENTLNTVAKEFCRFNYLFAKISNAASLKF